MSSILLRSTYFCGRSQCNLMALPSTSKVKSLIGSGATSSGGRTGVLRPQAEKTKKEIEMERRKQRAREKAFRLLAGRWPPTPGPQPLDFRLWTLDFRLINEAIAAAAAPQIARCRRRNDDDQPPTPGSDEGKDPAQTAVRSAATLLVRVAPALSSPPDTRVPLCP